MITRRRFIQYLAGTGMVTLSVPGLVPASTPGLISKPIPVSGERLPVIGMGSWLTFDVESSKSELTVRARVLQEFFARGGALIDSSPMYNSSERVIGHCLSQINNQPALFAATKVWTQERDAGVWQMESSRKDWGIDSFDLIQIHNMVDWETHVETLKAWKSEGKIRYIGITTSHGRRHERLEEALLREPFDFVQLTYNLVDREAEQRLLPLAAEKGIAVIANRPLRGGGLFTYVKGRPLPVWAREFDCENWAQFFLKFIVAHPGVTCAIPATSKLEHMMENMGAAYGRLPDTSTRARMIHYMENL